MSGAVSVLLDATAIPAQLRGVGRYVEALARALDAGGGVALTVVCQQRDAAVFAAAAPGAEIHPLPARWSGRAARLLWEQVGLPRLARRLGVDVLHSPHYTMPLVCPVPVVVTLHDALFFTDAQLHTGVKARFFRAWTRRSLRRAAACLTDSAATAAELTRATGSDPGRLTVIHLGCDPTRFHPPGDAEREAASTELGLSGRRYLAFLGTLEPRKNIPELVAGFAAAVRDRADPPALVLAGGAGWGPGLDEALAAVPAGVTVLRPGYLPLDRLAGYLGGAELVVYPSLGEGFGLPVLEGMACGAAVLTTRRLALPEIGGDAVAYTGVSAAEIGAAIGELLDDPDRRAELGQLGVARAARFSWPEHARRCAQVYRTVAAAAGSRQAGWHRL